MSERKKDIHILVINPGSTSTKIGLFRNEEQLFDEKLDHDPSELKRFGKILDQKERRKTIVLDALKRRSFSAEKLSAIAARGGLLRPLESGVYQVNERMIADLAEARRGEHASNLAACIARDIALEFQIPAYIVDPVSVDEMEDKARLSGLEGIERPALSHALNMKAVSRRYAREAGTNYRELNLIVAHLGGGISLSAHRKGRMIDISNPREEGPFSPERSGSLPILAFAELCFRPGASFKEIERKVFTESGLFSYLGTKDLKKARQMANSGNEKAALVLDAMAFQISKEIGSMAAVLKGDVDAIIITGGIAYEQKLIADIQSHVSFIAKVVVYPGEDELRALAEGVLRVLRGEEKLRDY